MYRGITGEGAEGMQGVMGSSDANDPYVQYFVFGMSVSTVVYFLVLTVLFYFVTGFVMKRMKN